MAPVRATLTINHNGPGGWKLRIQNVDVPPTISNCSYLDVSGSFAVTLKTDGEPYVYPKGRKPDCRIKLWSETAPV